MAEPVKCGCRHFGLNPESSVYGDMLESTECLYPAAAEKAARLDKGVAELQERLKVLVERGAIGETYGIRLALRALGEEP